MQTFSKKILTFPETCIILKIQKYTKSCRNGGEKMPRIDKDKISFIMAGKGMLQKDLAEKSCMSRGNLSTIINGKNCQVRTIFKLADALGVDVTEILED